MKLCFVIWNEDTGFLVNIEDEGDPVTKAIEAHKIYDLENFGPYEDRDSNDVQHKDIENRNVYVVYDVDFDSLFNIIKRNDCRCMYKDVIIFDY